MPSVIAFVVKPSTLEDRSEVFMDRVFSQWPMKQEHRRLILLNVWFCQHPLQCLGGLLTDNERLSNSLFLYFCHRCDFTPLWPEVGTLDAEQCRQPEARVIGHQNQRREVDVSRVDHAQLWRCLLSGCRYDSADLFNRP